MKRILFGKRAVKKHKLETATGSYKVGGIALGSFFREKIDAIEFKLPNGKTAVCYKEYIKNELEAIKDIIDTKTTPSFFMKTFNPELYVELMILGERQGRYECTFFVQKMLRQQSLVTGFITHTEEIGYTVEIGMPNKRAVVQTNTKYKAGDLGVFQVSSVSGSTYLLSDETDREIYIGEREEIAPGIILRATITGIPKHIRGEEKAFFTKRRFLYTCECLGIRNAIVESSQELENGAGVRIITVYISEDRETIHCIPFDEYQEVLQNTLPSQEYIGRVFEGTVTSIGERSSVVKMEEVNLIGILSSRHYTDHSTNESVPLFKEGDTIKVKIFCINGYLISLTAKETLINSEDPIDLDIGAIVKGVVKDMNATAIKCETINRNIVWIKRATEEEPYIGKLYNLQVNDVTGYAKVYLGNKLLADGSNEVAPTTLQGKTKEARALLKKGKEPRRSWKEIAIEEAKKYTNGQIVEGVITKIYPYGAFAKLSKDFVIRIKIAEVSSRFVKEWMTLLHLGQAVKMVLYDIDYENGRVEGSIKKYEILNMASTHTQIEPEAFPRANLQEPLAYGIEEEEESLSEAESENDEELEMELFNSKDNAEPWTKRIISLPLKKAVEIWRKALKVIESPESKKKVCVALVSAMGASPTPLTEEDEDEVLKEGVKRDGSNFLKKSIDNTRLTKNTALYKKLCLMFIRQRKESPYGFKELIFLAQKEQSLAVLSTVSEQIACSELKAADKKEVEMEYIGALYAISKKEARTAIEKSIASVTNKNKVDWIIKHINLEVSSIKSLADINYTRNILDRSVVSDDVSPGAAKGIFKIYLKFEKDYGTKETVDKVIEMAKTYVSSLPQ
ncbi:hypothetical protein NEDG_01709 [Nematocida displodere]|uniref:S1 motif domain-containing protein n=1 Tax=Nematocida displodere TaxID=1805483 RepID=A0A177EEI6_9MICR|nr:hypothetical protein NEDG_01709 [Nematocida displodere]